jgi:hypothetical protein
VTGFLLTLGIAVGAAYLALCVMILFHLPRKQREEEAELVRREALGPLPWWLDGLDE